MLVLAARSGSVLAPPNRGSIDAVIAVKTGVDDEPVAFRVAPIRDVAESSVAVSLDPHPPAALATEMSKLVSLSGAHPPSPGI